MLQQSYLIEYKLVNVREVTVECMPLGGTSVIEYSIRI